MSLPKWLLLTSNINETIEKDFNILFKIYNFDRKSIIKALKEKYGIDKYSEISEELNSYLQRKDNVKLTQLEDKLISDILVTNPNINWNDIKKLLTDKSYHRGSPISKERMDDIKHIIQEKWKQYEEYLFDREITRLNQIIKNIDIRISKNMYDISTINELRKLIYNKNSIMTQKQGRITKENLSSNLSRFSIQLKYNKRDKENALLEIQRIKENRKQHIRDRNNSEKIAKELLYKEFMRK